MKKQILLLALFCMTAMSSMMAQSTITGTVSSSDGPLIGANILIKNTATGTTTDIDGAFSIQASPEDILMVSYIGYLEQEVAVGNRGTVDIVLEEGGIQLQDIVVTATGFKESRDKIASTYSKIDPDAIGRTGEPTLINSLAGKAAGVKISATTSDPGAGANIQIRGQNTIQGNTQPLIIVDGIPFNNDNIDTEDDAGVAQQSRLNDINPDDIETFQVFKGASAGAIYGSRAANGVIVITTKRGKKGKMKIDFTTSLSVDAIFKKHPMQTSFGQGTGGKYNATNANSWGDRIADRSGAADDFKTGAYFEADNGNKYYAYNSKNSQETFVDSNFDAVFQNAVSKDYKISFSGGNDNGTYYFSAGHTDQDGIIKESYYKKYNATLSGSYKFTDWLTNSTKFNYSTNNSNRIQQGSNTAGIYLGLLRTPPDFDNRDYIGTYYDASGNPFPLRHRSYRRYLGQTTNPTYNNPSWTILEQKSLNDVDRIIGSTEFNAKVWDDWTVILRAGVDKYTDNRIYFFPQFTAGADRIDGRLDNEVYKNTEYNYELLANKFFQLSDKIGFNFTVGGGLTDQSRKSDVIESTNFLFNSRLPSTSVASVYLADTYYRNRRFARAYTQGQFDIDDMLNVNLGLAYEDYSSSSEPAYYPSAEIGWQFHKMLGNKPDWLSFTKLRAAYGVVATGPAPHRFQTTYETKTYSTYSDIISLNAFGGGFGLNDDKGNPDLVFERKKEYEIGLDLRFYRNRIALSTTYYSNKIEDILLDVDLAPSSGFNNIYANAASIQNKGIEIEADFTLVRQSDFEFGIYTNFSRNRNKVTSSLNGDTTDGKVLLNMTSGSSVKSSAVIGQPMGILMGTAALRDANGDYDLDDNGFPQLDQSGDKVIGDPNPDWRGGLGFRTSYKGLNLNVLFETSQGNDIGERTRYVLYGFGTHADTGNEVTLTKDLYNVAGDLFTAGTTVRGNIQDFGGGDVLLDEAWYTTLGGGFGSSIINEFAIGDASWTRLREVSLSYKITNAWLKSIGLGSVDITAIGRNLALWTDIQGIDPDVNQFGVGNGIGLDYFTNPSTKSYAVSLKLNF